MKRLAQYFAKNLVLIVLLMATLANGLAWSFVIPFDGAPDEVHKYDVVYFMWKHNRIPVFGPQPGADVYIRPAPGTRDGYVYDIVATYPPGAYLLSALLMHLAPANSPTALLHAARLVGVFCNVALAYLAYRIVFALFGSSTYSLSIAAFVAFIPQVAYTGGYVGDDAYSVMAVTWSIWALIQGVSARWSGQSSWVFGLALAATTLGKQNGWVAVIPFVLLALLWSTRLLTWPERFRAWRGMSLLPALTLGSWLVRNWILYRDWMALKIGATAWQDYMTRLGLASSPPAAQGIGPIELLTKTFWPQFTFESFWGRFFYLNVPMPPAVYTALLIGCTLGVAGTVWAIVSSVVKRRPLFPQLLALQVLVCSLLAFAVLTAINLWTNVYNDFQPQGRYFFPLLVPIGIVLTLGLYKLQLVHPRAAKLTWGIVLLAMALLNVFALNIVRTHPYPAIPLPNF